MNCLTSKKFDSDYEGFRRDEVKDYLKNKYGEDYFSSVGTYGNYKLKQAFADLCSYLGISFSDKNFYSKMIDKEFASADLSEVVRLLVTKEPKLKRMFTHRQPKLLELLELFLMQPKTRSVHASATIIVPDEVEGVKRTIYDYFPVRSVNGQLVSEWEGKQLEKAGFLKEDILGLSQLDKLKAMIALIKQNHGVTVDPYQVPLDDLKVYEYFAKGFTEDIFQFGTAGLKRYCQEVEPSSIEELAAVNALYRPGPMESNAHNDYVAIKFNRKTPDYDPLLEDITKSTYGLYSFQEQTMQAFQRIADATLTQADQFRSFISKLKGGHLTNQKFLEYQNLFIDGYMAKGVEQEKAKYVWDKLIAFATYGFNRSHAVCYAYLGYITQWFKVNYPLEFWIVALSFSHPDKLSEMMREIRRTGNIKLFGPDVNKSTLGFNAPDQHSIYWSLDKVKQCGPKLVDKIIKEREANGEFFSVDEFIARTKCDRRAVFNLIVSGAFDTLHDITSPLQRRALAFKFFEKYKINLDDERYTAYRTELASFWWQKKAKELCGYGPIIYYELIDRKWPVKFISPEKIDDEASLNQPHAFAGIITQVLERKTRQGEPFAQVLLDHNDFPVSFIVWPDKWREIQSLCVPNKILTFIGELRKDEYRPVPTFYSCFKTQAINF